MLRAYDGRNIVHLYDPVDFGSSPRALSNGSADGSPGVARGINFVA